MQQAIPYKSWVPLYTNSNNPLNPSSSSKNPISNLFGANTNNKDSDFVKGSRNMGKLVKENAIIVFGRRGCCMSHVVKRLLLGLGVNPPICEVEEEDEAGILQELEEIVGKEEDEKRVLFPAVFIGGELFGGLDRLMATHISGELVPILKEAGALWL